MAQSFESLEILRWGRNRNLEKKRWVNFQIPHIYGSNPRVPYVPAPKRISVPTQKQDRTYNQRVIIKVSYKRFSLQGLSPKKKATIISNTAEAIEYFFRFDENAGFSKDKDVLSKGEAHERFADDAIFKMIISPEDPRVLDREYIRMIMRNLESELGVELEWAAVFHTNGDHPHAHVIISRTKSEGTSWQEPLQIDPYLIKQGIRYYAEDLATRILGRKTSADIRHSFTETLRKIGLARIDHVIAGNPRKGTNLFVPTGAGFSILDEERLRRLPKWQRELVETRLTFLSSTGLADIRNVNGEWRCYEKDLRATMLKIDKLKQFEGISPDDIKFEPNPKESFSGTVVEHRIVDDNDQKIGLVIKDKEGQLHYVESEMEWSETKDLQGAEVEVLGDRATSKKVRRKR